MVIDFKELDGWLIATPEFQRLDALAARDFTARLVDRCGGATRMVLDMTHVSFVDSRGLAALVSVFKVLSTGGILRLAKVGDQVEMLLTMTRLNALFPIFPTVEDAIKA